MLSTSCYSLRALLIIAVSLLWWPNAWSSHTESKRQLLAGVELFRWQEFGANQERLLSEQGARITLQGNWDNLIPANRLGQINLMARVYSGDLNYDGQTQSLTPALDGIFVASRSRYDGLDAELQALHPLKKLDNTALLLSIGFDLWRRDIQDTTDAQGNPVSGAIEDYQLLYTRLGLQKQHHADFGSSRTRIGIKYPLRVDEQASGIGPTLHPGSKWSVFASYRLNLANRRHTIIDIYFDSLRFAPSPTVTDQYGDPWLQPQSQQDTLGIMLGVPF